MGKKFKKSLKFIEPYSEEEINGFTVDTVKIPPNITLRNLLAINKDELSKIFFALFKQPGVKDFSQFLGYMGIYDESLSIQ